MLEKYIENAKLRNTIEWVLVIVIAFAIFLFLRSFVITNAEITGNSMEPTLAHGDRVFITRFSYLLSEPKYQDIIAFHTKDNNQYIKRVIGFPGDEIDIVDYKFTVNGESLQDRFSEEPIYYLGDVSFPMTVPEGSYFVLGDNRNLSDDSRVISVGCIEKEYIIGKVRIRFWPFNKIGFLD